MASRPRSLKRRGWPDGLYERNGYFSWRDPRTGRELGIGRVTLGEAKAQASEANIAVQGLEHKPRLVDRLNDTDDQSLRAWLDKFEAKLATRKLATQTRRQYKSHLKRAREILADQLDLPTERVTTKHIADGLEQIADKPTTAAAVRSLLVDAFDSAIAAGWTQHNPVKVSEVPQVEIMRARLTWPVFQQLYASLPAGRLKNAVAVALVSGQARETVSAGEFNQVGMEAIPGGEPVECWRVKRGKTGALIAIPLDLRLDAFGMSLRDVFKQCRSTGVASRYIVHNTRGEGPVGRRMPRNAMSDEFTAAVLELGIDWGTRTPPTFHELRSLSKRLYEAQGGVDTIDLLGHQSDEMGELYADGRGAEYKLVSLG